MVNITKSIIISGFNLTLGHLQSSLFSISDSLHSIVMLSQLPSLGTTLKPLDSFLTLISW